MNNIEYIILSPNRLTVSRNAEGHILALAHTGKPGYLSVDDFDRLAEAGRITIHKVGGNEIAAQFGRVQVAYTINN